MELVGETEVVRIGGVVYPVKWLSEALGMVDPGNKSDQDTPYHHLLLLNLGENSVALVVDRILEGREIVVKPLGTHLRRVAGIAGATLMGDGEVVLILHVAELLTDQAIRQPAFDAPRQPSQSSQNWDIMVVDDSVSVRRVVSKLVTNAGWTPHPAKDGQDALEQMQTMKTLPTAILLDVEMPRMNGYELTTTLRANPATAHIPIVMLTSRAGDKHREKAMSLGASAYLVKPYQEEELIDTVKRLVTKNGHFAEKITIHA
jgi:chemosensory pili system protein ChpA (sensor histidine kinase/response regulator)